MCYYYLILPNTLFYFTFWNVPCTLHSNRHFIDFINGWQLYSVFSVKLKKNDIRIFLSDISFLKSCFLYCTRLENFSMYSEKKIFKSCCALFLFFRTKEKYFLTFIYICHFLIYYIEDFKVHFSFVDFDFATPQTMYFFKKSCRHIFRS